MPTPFPPFDLATRTSTLEGLEDPFAWYEGLGRDAKARLLDLLPEDWSFEGKRCLDFGCGAGRTLRHFLGEAQQGELWGADIDEPSVAWVQEHLAPVRAVVCDVAPPLPFDSASVDLAWALSVFTHLTDHSIPWLVELHRILEPGGLLVASYMGRYTSGAFDPEPWEEDEIGMNVLRHDNPWELGGPMVLMSDWWVQEHWGRGFELLASAPEQGQTWALLRKRDVALTVEEVARPADDPREVLALRRNVRQLQRELEARAVDAVRRAVQQDFEQSLSWRITAPLRRAKAEMRARRR